MKVIQLSDSLAVSGQISVEDVAMITGAGFKVLINNRPDHEVSGQPTSEEIAAAAQEAGLVYYYLPVTAGDFPGEGIEQMATLIDDLDTPALAFCRSGTRCTNLWIVTRNDEQRGACVARARQLGFDLSMALR